LQALSEVEVARLGDDVAQANLRAASAQQEAARLGKEAEDERMARLKLEAKVADRKLPDDQKKILVGCLMENPGQITIDAVADNSEAYRYAQAWRDLFVSAHWNTDNEQHIPIRLFSTGGVTWSGVRLNIHGTVVSGQMQMIAGSAEATLWGCLKKTHGIGVVVMPYADTLTGHAVLW
jgi:hypothetical protein